MTPPQVGFPGARLAARLETRVRRKRKWTRQVAYLIGSRTPDEMQSEGMLRTKRGYRVVENRLHHCPDITLGEDQAGDEHPTQCVPWEWCDGAW